MSAPTDTAAFVAELKRRRPGYTPEWLTEETGPGAAIDQALARFLATIDERLGQAADRQQLALLDLLGVSLIPSQAARAPMVFSVAADTVPGRVPPGTRLAADPPKPEATAVDPIAPPEVATTMPPGPISFEAERGIGLAAGRIVELRSLWPGRDQSIDHIPAQSTCLPFQASNLAELKPVPRLFTCRPNARWAPWPVQATEGCVRTESGKLRRTLIALGVLGWKGLASVPKLDQSLRSGSSRSHRYDGRIPAERRRHADNQ